MKIAVVTPYFPVEGQPYRGHSTYQTLRRLARHEQIHVFCPLTRYPSWLQPKNFPYSRADLSYSPPDIAATYFEYPGLPLISRATNGYVCARLLKPYIERYAPDVILNYWIYPEGYAAVRVGKKLNVPVILGALGSDLNRIPGAVTRRLTQSALRDASFIISVSEHLRQQAIKLGAYPERTRTILNGADTAVFHLRGQAEARQQLGLPQHEDIIVFVGRLDVTKGVMELIEAFNSVVRERPQSRLVFVGDGLARRDMEEVVKAGGIACEVTFAGTCSGLDVARWMAASDVFVLPSYAEGCPNVVVEALACGRPVVASNVGGIPELVDDRCGILLPPQNAGALAQALRDALARDWDTTAIAQLHSRSWDDVARETQAVCRDVVARSKGEASHGN